MQVQRAKKLGRIACALESHVAESISGDYQ
jgi:hypothetical protein